MSLGGGVRAWHNGEHCRDHQGCSVCVCVCVCVCVEGSKARIDAVRACVCVCVCVEGSTGQDGLGILDFQTEDLA